MRCHPDAQGEKDRRELTPEEAEKFLQETRDAECQRRAAKRREAMRRQGRVGVKKDW